MADAPSFGGRVNVAIKGAQKGVEAFTTNVHDRVASYRASPYTWFYASGMIALLLAEISAIFGNWFNDTWGHCEFQFRTFFATSTDVKNIISLQYTTGVQASFYAMWFFGGFTIGSLSVFIGSVIFFMAYAYMRYAVYNTSGKKPHGVIGRFIAVYVDRTMGVRESDPLLHMLILGPMIMVDLWLMWTANTSSDIVTLVIFPMLCIVIRFSHFASEWGTWSVLYRSKDDQPVMENGQQVRVRQRHILIYLIWTMLLVIYTVWLSWWFWKYPTSDRIAFEYGVFWVTMLVQWLIWLDNVLYASTHESSTFRNLVTLVLTLVFCACVTATGAQPSKRLSQLPVKSGLTYWLVTAQYLICFWPAWVYMPDYIVWPTTVAPM